MELIFISVRLEAVSKHPSQESALISTAFTPGFLTKRRNISETTKNDIYVFFLCKLLPFPTIFIFSEVFLFHCRVCVCLASNAEIMATKLCNFVCPPTLREFGGGGGALSLSLRGVRYHLQNAQ